MTRSADAAVLRSKRALVTGASSGMGAEIAKAYAAAGAAVTMSARNEERLDAVRRQIGDGDGAATAIACDLVEPGAPERLVAAALEAMGGIDVLANVAGVMELAPFDEATLESLDRQYATNVRAPFALSQAALPSLREAKGTIIFVSSLAAAAAFPDSAAYTASKGGVDALARQLAMELGPDDVRVNAIAPGEIDTPMNTDFYATHPQWLETIADFTPARRIGRPQEVAQVAVFLASDMASFVYGVSLPVDGGVLAR
jgi:NAD(P)-dependent dehydrogenase (short-subunit alcohol dehydrogenase family)